jgi:proteasome lid subunit RPN8/RPN11
MRISQDLVDELIAHARDEAPNECCGMIGGGDGTATTIHRVRNDFASPLSFHMDSGEQIKAWNAIQDAGNELVAIYHSHTSTAAQPSQTDINQSEMWQDVVHVIVSLADAQRPDVRGFWIRGKNVNEAELEIV